MPARTVSRVLARQRAAAPVRAGPDHRRAAPGQQGHRGALRTRPTRRAGPHGRQEDRTDPRRRGWRAHGRPMGSTAARRTATLIGFDYVHSVVDDHSRLAYSEILPDEKGPTCAAFLDRAIGYFAAHGITRIERLMTDNAWAYRYSLREICATPRHHARSSSNPTAPGRTARSNASTAPCRPSGPTGRSSPPTTERAAALAPWLEHQHSTPPSALAGHQHTTRTPGWRVDGPTAAAARGGTGRGDHGLDRRRRLDRELPDPRRPRAAPGDRQRVQHPRPGPRRAQRRVRLPRGAAGAPAGRAGLVLSCCVVGAVDRRGRCCWRCRPASSRRSCRG